MSANGVAVKVQSHSKALARSTAVKRDDIQGLRAFAIVSVFIYHLNAQILPFGYLGVDMFFVISGFLMAMILDAKGKITVRVAVDFYYRRLRRILPTYLLAVLLTLVLAVFCVNPMDRQDVVEDARAAMRLYSNIQPLLRQVTYFQLLNNYAFFAHSWSLCVEMQFYTVVPFLFALFYPLSKAVRCKVCVGVGIVTFFAQLFAPPLFQHGFTPVRMWQFMSGILVYYTTQQTTGLLSSSETVSNETNSTKEASYATPSVLLNAPLCIGLSSVMMFMNENIFCPGLARFLCTAMAAAIIYVGAYRQSWLMTNRLVMWIGDHSYTIYLCHWPVIVYWRYLFGNGLDIQEATAIVLITLFLTAIIDRAMDVLMGRLKSQTASLVFILVLYLSCEPILGYLSGTARSKQSLSVSDEMDTRQLIRNYYNKVSINLTDEEALRFNGFLLPYARHFKGCNHAIGLNASKFNTTRREVFICREEGRGDKRALIIGNSLARHAFVGVAHHFRDVYRSLQLHSIENCSPFRLERETEEDCRKYVKSIEAAFREYQPDVIFIIYRGQSDEILKAMRGLYNLAASYATQLVFIPTVEIRFRVIQPMDAILDALRTGQSLKLLGMSKYRYYYNGNRPFHWMRVRNATCEKCQLVDWSGALSTNDWLPSTDVEAKLTHFIDRLHVSDIGSYHFGKLLRSLYDTRLRS
ncbi:hypothetical protein M3Y98_00658700 [Aphelenchoides besseyi]|nr:hypothetical protein M3Y98_00658700 [Aphelenchoides besseyi]